MAACDRGIEILEAIYKTDNVLGFLQITDDLKDSTLKISTRAMKEGSVFSPLITALTEVMMSKTGGVKRKDVQNVVKLIRKLKMTV